MPSTRVLAMVLLFAGGCLRTTPPDTFVCKTDKDCDGNERCGTAAQPGVCVPKNACSVQSECAGAPGKWSACVGERCTTVECLTRDEAEASLASGTIASDLGSEGCGEYACDGLAHTCKSECADDDDCLDFRYMCTAGQCVKNPSYQEDVGGSEAVFPLDGDCKVEGELGCAGPNSRPSLICKHGKWAVNYTCEPDQRCDTRLGLTQGRCSPTLFLCRDRAPGEAFCDGAKRMLCGPDLLTSTDKPCDAGFSCTDTLGEVTCTDIDECATDNGGCGDHFYVTCKNELGAPPTCTDIDECATDNGNCGDPKFFECTNEHGAAPSCSDIDECASDNGGCGDSTYYACTNHVGAKPSCADIDECATNNGGCGNYAYYQCTNHDGAAPTCADIDECATDNGGCGALTYYQCTNNEGAAPGCADIDECATSNGNCGDATYYHCTNEVGAAPTCSDIDECATGNGGCGVATDYLCMNKTGAAPDCAPVLTSLGLSLGTLQPSLSPLLTSYRVQLTVAGQSITLTPTAAAGASVTINGNAVTSGQPWQSGMLNLGANAITVVVSQASYVSRTYTINVMRGFSEQDHLFDYRATGFGKSTAISGNTIVVGAPDTVVETGGSGCDNYGYCTTYYYDTLGTAYVFVRNGNIWSEQAELRVEYPDYGDGDRFGDNVAIDGDTIVVGAPGEDSNGSATNNSATDSGAAYVFVRDAGTWSRQAYLKASNVQASDGFGASVAVSGNTIVVGASGEDSSATGINGNEVSNTATSSGAAYVFTRNGTSWSSQAYLKASNTGSYNYFGSSVAISADTIAVGAYGEESSATGINGNQADNAATSSGACYVFFRTGSTWSQQAYIKASNTGSADYFGASVSLSGDTLAVGAYGEDSTATGVDGNQADNSASSSGAAYVFQRSGASWSQQAYLKASNPDASDMFGVSVSISGDRLISGAYYEDSNAITDQTNNGAQASGAAYAFARSGITWTQEAYLKASVPGAGDNFGNSVAVSGDTFVCSANRQNDSHGYGYVIAR